jgi:hypothetical protein
MPPKDASNLGGERETIEIVVSSPVVGPIKDLSLAPGELKELGTVHADARPAD